MSEIPIIIGREIKINDIQIQEIPTYNLNNTSNAIPFAAPVTVNIGVPVVDIPGCVEAHETNNPKNNQVNTDDPKGTVTFCDAGVPNFNPIDYSPEEMVITRSTPVDTRIKQDEKTSEQTESLPTPPAPKPPLNTAKIECPTQKQLAEEPVGFIFDSGRKEVTGYKLVGTQCVREVRDVPIIEQAINGLPPTGTVITTGGIAVVATTSALLAKPFADILLKVIKPVVKKVLKKVATIRGKQMKILSVEERRAEQRDRNQAIAKLKSVVAKTKKKG